MLPFRSLLIIDRSSQVPVYQQVANRLVTLIGDGTLKPGSLLPSSREMAFLLQLHRKTIVAAYDELFAQDWIETLPRKGVMVAQHLPVIKPRTFSKMMKKEAYGASTGFQVAVPGREFSMISASGHRLIINDGFPDARIAPVDMLMKEYRQLFHRPAVQRMLMYGHVAGSPNLRKVLAAFLLNTRSIDCQADNILMTRGAQMSLYIAARIILQPGSTVIVGEPNYFLADQVFQECGAKLVRVPVDENGIDVEKIEKICKRKRPDLLYIIPHHHHPTTVTLAADRRMRLLQLIRQYDLPVIEDDYDYDFHYNSSPILPLASADHGGNVIYIGSLTKTLAPSVKTGYMLAPVNFIQEAIRIRRLIDIRGDDLFEEAMAVLFSDGTMQRHLKKSVKLYHERRDMFCRLLSNELKDLLSFSIPQGGMAIWARFHKKYSLADIARRASVKGLYISDGKSYNNGDINYNALRMGFASLNEKEMVEAVTILKGLMFKV